MSFGNDVAFAVSELWSNCDAVLDLRVRQSITLHKRQSMSLGSFMGQLSASRRCHLFIANVEQQRDALPALLSCLLALCAPLNLRCLQPDCPVAPGAALHTCALRLPSLASTSSIVSTLVGWGQGHADLRHLAEALPEGGRQMYPFIKQLLAAILLAIMRLPSILPEPWAAFTAALSAALSRQPPRPSAARRLGMPR